MSLLYLVFLLGSLQWICVRPETVEIGVDGDASYYDIDDDDADFDEDDFERRLMDFGIDLEGDDYVFVSFANSRVYPPINAESEWETRVNGDSIRRSLMGDSDAPKKGDKWLEVDHIDSVMGQYNGDDGVFIKHSEMEAALDTEIDLETFPNRRLISIDSSLVTKRCDDDSCDYSVDMTPFHRVLESESDDIPNEVILDSSDVMPQCNQLDCNIMTHRRLFVGKIIDFFKKLFGFGKKDQDKILSLEEMKKQQDKPNILCCPEATADNGKAESTAEKGKEESTAKNEKAESTCQKWYKKCATLGTGYQKAGYLKEEAQIWDDQQITEKNKQAFINENKPADENKPANGKKASGDEKKPSLDGKKESDGKKKDESDEKKEKNIDPKQK